MADNKKAVETSTRGNEWEVVSLTASANPAAPSVKGYEDLHLDEQESARALFISEHFVFPPAEDENLPIEHEEREAHGNYSEEQSNDQCKVSDDLLPGRDRSDKLDSERNGDRYTETAVIGEGNDRQGLNLVTDETSPCKTACFNSLSCQVESNDVTESEMAGKGEKPGLPCEGWWESQKVMHSHPNGSNAILTVAISFIFLFILPSLFADFLIFFSFVWFWS